jgi:TIR domain
VTVNFKQNLFISYAHIDDEPLSAGEKGWITRFHATLKAILSMRLGREAKIWRDEKLQGNDVFSNEIVAQFRQSALLISVVTPRYLNSEWCTREAHEFCQAAQQTGGLVIGNKSRVFKVIKTPVDNREAETLPAHMKDLIGFDFFAYKDGAPLELDPDFGPEYSQLYKQKVALLAQDIAQLLKVLESAVHAGKSDDPESLREARASGKPVVYLAECSYDRKPQRELLEGELKRLGYPVLPDRRLPADEAEFIAAAQGLLARCALSIHLVGEKYGAVPDGPTDKSVAMLQNEAAVAQCRVSELKRLIWLPQGTSAEDDRQRKFIAALHTDAEAQLGADLIAGDIEELRAAVHSTLRQIEQPEPKRPESTAAGERPAPGDSAKLLYFICDGKDRKPSVPVRKLCKQLGFDVALPAFEGEASEIRKSNQQNLASCAVVVVFYGTGDEAWKRTIDNELKKMAGYRDAKLPPAVATYLAEPRTDDKQDMIDMEEPGLVDGLEGLAEPALTKFLQQAARVPAA